MTNKLTLIERIFRRAVVGSLDEKLIATAAADEALKAAYERIAFDFGLGGETNVIAAMRQELSRGA